MALYCIAFSPDGQYLATTGEDRLIHLLSVKDDFEEVWTNHDAKDSLWCLAWSPDSCYLAAGGGDKILRLYDIQKKSRKL
jgi:WD40 repeat protein